MKILINRTDAIGDTLLSIPLGRLIKYHYPQAQLGFILSSRSAPLVKLCAGVDQVYTLDTKASPKKKWQQCAQFFGDFSPSHYFHLGGDFTPSAYAFFKGVPFRGGLVSKVPSFLFLNQGVRQSRSQVHKHESEYNMDLAAPMGVTWDEKLKLTQALALAPLFQLDRKKRKDIRNERFNFEGKELIFIHPGMSGHTLNWPNQSYGELANLLYNKFGQTHKLVVSFTPSDRSYVEGMALAMDEQTRKATFFFDGAERGLVDFCYALSLAQLFIGPSTGTTHMANAMRIKQVALYSPIKVQSEKRWGPFFRDDHVVVLAPLQEDFHEYGRENIMASIAVDQVFKHCCDLLIN